MLYYIIGKIYLGCNGKFEAGYGLLHLQKNSLRNITGRSCRKETNAFSNNPKNEAFMNMTLNELVRIKEMWNI